MNVLVLDLETQESFFEVKNKDPEKLRISLLGAYFYPEKKYLTFKENELWNFWPIFERVDLLVGHNILGFDLPVLKKYYGKNFSNKKMFDIMYEAREKIGFRLKLDDVARATLDKVKSGDGLKAIELFKEKKWQELESYCLDDVRLTKEIFDHILEKGYIYYPSMLGKEKIIISKPFLLKVK